MISYQQVCKILGTSLPLTQWPELATYLCSTQGSNFHPRNISLDSGEPEILGKGHLGLCQDCSTCSIVAYVAYGCTESESKQTVLWLKACGAFTKLNEKSFIQ